ncbi:MgtC/SapB family protein, partial [Candidatus Woesearchaeota archaeon]|nr:MgtC/SapB family protein [Candidatus Woesearchaeota archaeon]
SICMDPHIYTLLKILLALVLGGIIGYERERFGHFAGIRTHILVCLTSAFLVSGFMNVFALDSVARVAAAIMTGIGFIGAGSILRHGKDVQGLTTAASVWAVAGLGIIIGIGMIWEAVVVTLLAVIVLEMRMFALKHKKI